MKSSTLLLVVGGAAALGAVLLFASKASAQPASGDRQGKTLPWIPPGLEGVVPVLVKSRDTRTTAFPIDVWSFPSGLIDSLGRYLAVASDDPTSFVGLTVLAAGIPVKTVIARGPGPLTSQIEAQI